MLVVDWGLGCNWGLCGEVGGLLKLEHQVAHSHRILFVR